MREEKEQKKKKTVVSLESERMYAWIPFLFSTDSCTYTLHTVDMGSTKEEEEEEEEKGSFWVTYENHTLDSI